MIISEKNNSTTILNSDILKELAKTDISSSKRKTLLAHNKVLQSISQIILWLRTEMQTADNITIVYNKASKYNDIFTEIENDIK